MKWYCCMKILSCFMFQFVWLMPVSSNCIAEERVALLQLKQGIPVDNCGLFESWSGQECCNWHGIRCSNRSGHVIGLNLSGIAWGDSCLKGTVSPSLVELKHLKSLDLSFNDFNHSIPAFIGSLVNLEHLHLSHSNFQGEIPHQLANLSSLISLDLSIDKYSGSIIYSNSLGWLSHLTLLREIDLGGVNLSLATDWIQVVNTLPYLRSLRMDECTLPPSVPRSSLSYANSSTTLRVLSLSQNSLNDSLVLPWVSNFVSLEYLDLSYNRVSGSIPTALGNLHLLSYLDLSSNDLEGVIPSSIFDLKHMEFLRISYNNIQGIQFLNSSDSLCRLQTLDLSYNHITSDFANIIIQAFSGCGNNSLVTLDVSNNRFWGSIPDLIGVFSSLEELSLGNNQLNGTISPSLGQLSRLSGVNFPSNSFRGTFSNQHLSNLSKITYLDLSYNPELVVNFSADWVPPFQLGYITLSFCKCLYFPKWLHTQASLAKIDLSNAGISDTIPTSFWQSFSFEINYLNLSNNKIHGWIPDMPPTTIVNDPTVPERYRGVALQTVDLSSNYIEGAIPSFLGNATILVLKDNRFSRSIASFCPKYEALVGIMDLSNNFLSGELPDCWQAFKSLQYLGLDNNNFTGKIPPSMGALYQLGYLSMRNNSFNGELQISLLGNQSLRFLDLAHNSFSGNMSTVIESISNAIQILDLRSNKFFGKLPSSICRLGDLKILDLSQNQISGIIPECICHLQGMAGDSRQVPGRFGYGYIGPQGQTGSYDISDMIMWKRKEQTFGSTLFLVTYMAISDNMLQGGIPSGSSCLKGLGSLDLARNNLSGPIPPKISEMNSLEFLDLSRNHLSGQIPSSLADLNFLGILDLSYNNLSGIIPTGTQLQSMDATAYAGNPGLCGPPLAECTRRDPAPNTPKEANFDPEEEKNDSIIFPGLYISVVLGFIVGFWGVCGTLVIKRSWRHTYFRHAEDIYDRLYVMVVVTIPRIWRRT